MLMLPGHATFRNMSRYSPYHQKRREAPAFMPGRDRRWARRAQCPSAQQDPRSARTLNGRGHGRGGSPGMNAGEDVPQRRPCTLLHALEEGISTTVDIVVVMTTGY